MRPALRIALLGTSLSLALCGCEGGETPGRGPRVIVLGIDGMDPDLLSRFLRAGRMENFSRLERIGGLWRLGTSMPPQSPVAWSSFITGMNPGGHGIFDFLRHDRRSFAVAASTATRKEPFRLLGVPLWGGGMENLRRGRAFWEYLEEAEIDATVFRVPANFPPVGRRSRTFSGMGTPDLRGTNGTFTYYTEEPPANAAEFSGGAVVPVEALNDVMRSRLEGPPNPYRDGAPTAVELTVYRDPERPVVRVDIGGERRVLADGEWSDWVRVSFSLLPGVSVRGIVRFYLKEVRPALRLYASPVNVDPADPALPIATPASAAQRLCACLGPFYTQGMAEDTKALQWNVLDDEEFLDQAWIVLEERKAQLEHELDRFRDRAGFLFFYFSSIDLTSHVLWRALDPAHPAHSSGFSQRVRQSLEDLYAEMDGVLGRVLEEVDERTTLIVMSDHGFAPFYRAVHLNNWLAEEGFLSLYEPGEPRGKKIAEDVDWSRTRAYALGFNGIYVNQEGREAVGLVTERSRASVLDEIERRLLGWRDPRDGKPVVARVYRPGDIYSGPYVHLAPDLIVGYARGYRASWDTPVGELGPASLEENRDAWSGDHLMAAEAVPGVLLANRPLRKKDPRLVDLPVTILDLFGISRPQGMTGTSVFKEAK